MQGHLASRADSGDKTEKRERVGRRHGAVHVLVHELGAVEGVEVADLEPLCRRSLTRGCGLGGNRLLFRKSGRGEGLQLLNIELCRVPEQEEAPDPGIDFHGTDAFKPREESLHLLHGFRVFQRSVPCPETPREVASNAVFKRVRHDAFPVR